MLIESVIPVQCTGNVRKHKDEVEVKLDIFRFLSSKKNEDGKFVLQFLDFLMGFTRSQSIIQ